MKRFFDIVGSLILIVFLIPVFAVVGLIVLLIDGSPVMFRQQRIGKNGELFNVYKFRTMKNNTRNAATADLAESEEQITKCGRFLRKTSLDELPQVFNVLGGSMSFVGPRPLIPEEKEIHDLRTKYGVYSVRPGMTGLAQVSGRDLLTADEKALFDKEYVEKQSILFDIKICIKTVKVVFARENISEGGENKR